MMRNFDRAALSVGLALALAACGARLTRANFDRIETGMTAQEVERILGKPTEVDSIELGPLGGGARVWRDGERSVTITFVNDKVVMKVAEKL